MDTGSPVVRRGFRPAVPRGRSVAVGALVARELSKDARRLQCATLGFTFRAVFTASILVAFVWPSRCIASGVEIAGVVQHRQRPLEANVGPYSESQFLLMVDECRWHMRLVPNDGGATDYYDLSFDGMNSFFLNCFESSVRKAKAEGRAVAENLASANVRKSPVPSFSFAHQAGPIWLALASGCYFAGLRTNFAEPVATLDVLAGRDRYPDHYMLQRVSWTKSDNKLQIFGPQSVIYYSDTMDPFRAGKARTLEGPVTNACFKITSTTNAHGLTVPRSCYFQSFYVERGTTYVHEYEIKVTNIFQLARLGATAFQPKLPGVVFVTEERFNRNDGFHFNYAAKQWYSDSQVEDLPEFKRAVVGLGATRYPRRPPWHSVVLMGFFFLLLLGPLWMKWGKRKRVS